MPRLLAKQAAQYDPPPHISPHKRIDLVHPIAHKVPLELRYVQRGVKLINSVKVLIQQLRISVIGRLDVEAAQAASDLAGSFAAVLLAIRALVQVVEVVLQAVEERVDLFLHALHDQFGFLQVLSGHVEPLSVVTAFHNL